MGPRYQFASVNTRSHNMHPPTTPKPLIPWALVHTGSDNKHYVKYDPYVYTGGYTHPLPTPLVALGALNLTRPGPPA